VDAQVDSCLLLLKKKNFLKKTNSSQYHKSSDLVPTEPNWVGTSMNLYKHAGKVISVSLTKKHRGLFSDRFESMRITV
jgi:hypothetical protein